MSSPSSLVSTTIVQAGAGTGKTESLARRIVEAAEVIHTRKQAPPRFVATTFTERATSELRERVVSILSRKPEAPQWLVDFVQDAEGLHISTIHGTLSLILHRFGHLLGLDPEFTIMTGSEERDVLSRVLRSLFSDEAKFGILLEHYSFNELVIVARDLISHKRLHGAQFRVAEGWQAVLEKDRQELVEHLRDLKNADLDSLTANMAAKISQIGSVLGPIEFSKKDYERIRNVFLETLNEIRKPAIREGGKGGGLKPALDFIFDLKNEKWSKDTFDPLINARHAEVAQLFTELVEKASHTVNDIKKEGGFLTFDDLEFFTLDLVENHSETLASIRQEWDFWFVDEFQDTSPLQKKLLFYFFRTPWNAYFVGDPQQSIYLFRGADEHVFQDTKALVEKNNGLVERLSTNYRSHPDLLHFINRLFTTMKPPMELLEARGPRQNENRSHIYLAAEAVPEHELIFNQILEWKKLGYSFHDMAVLVRTNDKGREIARYLGTMGVPIYIHASGGYYDRREVLDALSLLSLLEDPSDDEVFILLARSPWIGIPDETLSRWGMSRGKVSYWDWLGEHPEEFENSRTLKILRQAVMDAEIRPLSTIFEKLIEDLGFLEFCLAGDASGRREANLRKMFFTLKDAEAQPGFSASHYIESAWRELNEPGEETEAASFIEPQRVNIMTIHKSKGLKFNCVIVPRAGDALRPKTQFLELAPDGRWAVKVLAVESEEKVSPIANVQLRDERFQRELAESARVFYVAVTRAAERVCLIGKQQWEGNSWLSQLGLPLSDGAHEGYDVTTWARSPDLEKLVAAEDQEMARAIKAAPPLSHLCHKMTVTELVQARLEHEKIEAAKKVTPSAYFQAQIEFQQRGQAIHSIFEGVKKTPHIALGELCDMARRRFASRLKTDANLISRTLGLTHPPLKKIIENGFAEWPFALRHDQIFLEGQVDLWGDVDGITWIIDYKSAEAFTGQSLKKAHEQLELYALAVHKTGRAWEQIRLAVVAPLQVKAEVLPLSDFKTVCARINPIHIDHWGEAEI